VFEALRSLLKLEHSGKEAPSSAPFSHHPHETVILAAAETPRGTRKLEFAQK